MSNQNERPRIATSEAAEDEHRNHQPTAPPAALPSKSEADAGGLPEGVHDLADVLAELARTLPGLKAALEHHNQPRTAPLTYRLDELAAALGVSRRAIERERSAGRFVAPDLTIGKMPLWRVETVRRYLERGGR
jgi:hypothetical protein